MLQVHQRSDFLTWIVFIDENSPLAKQITVTL
jgi:hypothetical protein